MSLLFGYLSILCWLNAQMPQVIKNYRLRNAEGLSFEFLTVWLAGDVANFIGCIITGQLPFQIYLSVYFIIIDTILCIQWLYYVKYTNNFIRRWFDGNSVEAKAEISEQSGLLKSSYNNKKYATMMMFVFLMTFNNNDLTTTMSTNNDISMLSVVDEDKTIWIGRFFAWVCTFLYLSSRIPQIYQNYRRRSVEGLSMFLFFFAAMGNLTYVLGIFTNPNATRATFLEAIPYIVGSAGTLVFDGCIFTQNAIYKNGSTQKDEMNQV